MRTFPWSEPDNRAPIENIGVILWKHGIEWVQWISIPILKNERPRRRTPASVQYGTPLELSPALPSKSWPFGLIRHLMNSSPIGLQSQLITAATRVLYFWIRTEGLGMVFGGEKKGCWERWGSAERIAVHLMGATLGTQSEKNKRKWAYL